MNILKSAEIKNFRGFDNLIIEDFSQINLFLGKNNSGKSSVLEALFLLMGMSNPLLPDNINRFRGLNIKDASDFKYLFHKLNFNNNPEFKGVFYNSTERNLKLNPIYGKIKGIEGEKRNIISEEASIDASTASPKARGIELEFSIKQKQSRKESFKTSMVLNYPEISQTLNNKYREELHAVYISGNNNDLSSLVRYSEILKRKKGDVVLNALKLIDPKIESIQALPDGLFFSYKDIDELLPSNISGDGVRKYLNIVTTIAEKENSIIFIDEIENGLHYMAHKLLWKSIIVMATEFNVQLFITSHSIETLRCLKELLEEEEHINSQDKLSVYKLKHTKNSGIKTYRYSYSGFKEAIETETELR
jgi:AAA15 family ATPase/GTPase